MRMSAQGSIAADDACLAGEAGAVVIDPSLPLVAAIMFVIDWRWVSRLWQWVRSWFVAAPAPPPAPDPPSFDLLDLARKEARERRRRIVGEPSRRGQRERHRRKVRTEQRQRKPRRRS